MKRRMNFKKIVIISLALFFASLSSCVTIKEDNLYYMDLIASDPKIYFDYKHPINVHVGIDKVSSHHIILEDDIAYQIISRFDDIPFNNKIGTKDYVNNSFYKKTMRYHISIQATYLALNNYDLYYKKSVIFYVAPNGTIFFDNLLTREEKYFLCSDPYAIDYFKLRDDIITISGDDYFLTTTNS